MAKKTKPSPDDQIPAVVSLQDLLDLIFWARRYCDGRSTYAPNVFNEIYSRLMKANPSLKEKDTLDIILMDAGAYWPFAQDGMYDSGSGKYNAIPSSELSDQPPQKKPIALQ